MIAQDYAQALAEIERPKMSVLREMLARRGHTRLLPQIYAQYLKLLERKERSKHYATVTPQQAQTRALVDLYRKLING